MQLVILHSETSLLYTGTFCSKYTISTLLWSKLLKNTKIPALFCYFAIINSC